MFLRGEVLILLVKVLGTFCVVKRNVLYTAPAVAISNKIACAVAMADPSFAVVRIQDGTGTCQGLKWDDNPQHEAGYTYLEKKTTEEFYNPPVLIQEKTQWLLPGTFGNGGRLDLFITPTPASASYSFRVMDITSMIFNVYGGEPERIIVSISANRDSNSVAFKTWTPEQWWRNHGSDTPFPFSEGETANISLVPDNTNMRILFDDRQVTTYAHPHASNPNDAKQLLIEIGAGNTLNVNSIIFIGV